MGIAVSWTTGNKPLKKRLIPRLKLLVSLWHSLKLWIADVPRVHVTIVKKDKQTENEISQIEYFSYYKKGHYANKCLDKQPKN